MGMPGRVLPNLRRYRDDKAWTQKQLSEKSGVAKATIARLEGGSFGAQPGTVRKLADALEVQPRDLIGNEVAAAAATPTAS